MRHQKHNHKLGRKKEHRIALMTALATALIKHGRIETTLAKAKALRPYAERLVTLAKKGGLANRRLAAARIRDQEAVQKLFDERASEFTDRNGGYTRIYKLGARIGDAAEMALIEFVPANDPGYRSTKRKSKGGKAAAKSPAAVVEKVKAEEETPAPEAPEVEKADPETPEAAEAEGEGGEEKK